MQYLPHRHAGLTLLLVRSFVPHRRLLRPLLTSRSDFHRRPFRHEVRSPQARTQSFPAQPPDLRRLTVDHKSFTVARSPSSASPTIRFLFISARFRTVPCHMRHVPTVGRSCSSLRPLWLACGGTCAHAGRTRKKKANLSAGLFCCIDYCQRLELVRTVHIHCTAACIIVAIVIAELLATITTRGRRYERRIFVQQV